VEWKNQQRSIMAGIDIRDVLDAVTFIAHFCTSVLGILAIWGLIKHRTKISAFVRLLAHSVMNERIKKIKGTLGLLDGMNFDVKDDRKEIIAILGQLAGMTRLFASRHEGFKQFHGELVLLIEKPETLSEAAKRRKSEELHALLDEQAFAAAINLMEVSNGRKNSGSH
jgi:hypothetical protein